MVKSAAVEEQRNRVKIRRRTSVRRSFPDSDEEENCDNGEDVEAKVVQEMGRRPDLSAGGCGGSKNSDGVLSFTMDADVLDCPICFENLAPPIFQCSAGHITCSSCRSKLNNCPSCSRSIHFRSRAIEKVIESMKVSCPYASSGCGEVVSFAHRHVHKEACAYSPCHCPIAECTFEGPIQELYHHFSSGHDYCAVSFEYNQSFGVGLPEHETFRVLRGKDGVLFLTLKNSEFPMGNAIMVVCLGPDSMKLDYTYQVVAKGKESSIQFNSSMTNIRRWEGVLPPKDFLLIPQNFFSGLPFLEIIVQNKMQAGKSILGEFCDLLAVNAIKRAVSGAATGSYLLLSSSCSTNVLICSF